MAIKLDTAIAAFNRLMPDEVLITRVKDADRVWDEVTMKYTTPDNVVDTLYRGPGLVGSTGPGQETEEGRQDIYKTSYSVRIPLDAGPVEEFRAGDRVLVIKAALNKHLQGEHFLVTEELLTSYPVSRRMLVTKATAEWQ